jgi:arginase
MALHTILVPYHFGSLRSGTGAGPEALASSGVLDGLPVSGTTTITVESTTSNEIRQSIAIDAALADAARHAREAGDVPVVFSGNCHACLGALAAIGGPAAIVWFDAHGDVNTPETTETGYFDGMALATALGWCWTNLARQIPGFAPMEERDVLLVGGRDLDRLERARLRRSNLRHYLPPALTDGPDAAFKAAIAAGGTKRAYVHLDLDVIDPSELSANQFKVPGGVSVSWLEAALGDVRDHYEIAGIAVTAYDPAFTAPAIAAPIVNRLVKALMR